MAAGKQKNQEYKTRDIAMATFLCMQGHESLRCEKIDGDKFAVMIFKTNPELFADVDLYHSGDARVEPRAWQDKFASVRENLMEAAGKMSRRGR
jgi:serine/threonine-protein kinase RIO1